MANTSPAKKLWEILDSSERKNALKVLTIAIMSAFASTLMVGSVMPFLSVLSSPEKIHTNPQLSWVYQYFNFSSSYTFLVALGVFALVIIFTSMAVQVLKVYAVARFTMMRMYSLSHRLMAIYLSQPYEYFLDHHSGEMGTRILSEAQEVVTKFLKPLADLITSALTVIALVAFLLWLEPIIALVAFCIFGGIYGTTYAISRLRLIKLGKIRVETNLERFRLASEALTGIKDIKLLGREGSYVDRFKVPSLRMAQAQTRTQVLSQLPNYAIQGFAFGGVVVLCLALLGPNTLIDGSGLSEILPVLGVFAFAGQRLMPELGRLYQSMALIQSGKAAVEAVHNDLYGDAPELPRQMPSRIKLKQQIFVNDVTYSFPTAQRASILNLHLTICAGEKIGVIGGTGAGKTTFADIVLGLLRPQTGQIVVDGVNLTDQNVRAWQQSVGYVPQSIYLADASLAENIALGIAPSKIDIEQVVNAAKIARIDQFITEELPDGYNTTVGERGVRLSGGQRQRIGIARAMYHNADLIVFDEATSALDNLTESNVMDAIQALPGEKTVIIIAHRLSTILHCDRVLVMESGKLIASGKWSELIEKNDYVRQLSRSNSEVV